MYKFLVILLVVLFSLSCNYPIFNFFAGGSLYKDLYYNVSSNQVISNHNGFIDGISLYKYIDRSTYKYERIDPAPNTRSFTIPKLKDSIDFYDFMVNIHYENDHGRMVYHIKINKELVKKKPAIYSRLTSH